MIDFGLAAPAVAAHFDRALLVIQDPITDLAERLNGIERAPASTNYTRDSRTGPFASTRCCSPRPKHQSDRCNRSPGSWLMSYPRLRSTFRRTCQPPWSELRGSSTFCCLRTWRP